MSNPKIRKLFDEATFEPDRIVYGMYHPYIPLHISGEETRLAITNKQINKFAELIVKECCEWIDGIPTTEEGTLILSKSFIIENLKNILGER